MKFIYCDKCGAGTYCCRCGEIHKDVRPPWEKEKE